MKTLKALLLALKFKGHISLRRRSFYGLQYIAGGNPENLVARYGGYKVVGSEVIDNVLIIYVD